MFDTHICRVLNSGLLAMALAAVVAGGCGPVDGPQETDFAVKIINHYAESLFTIRYEYTDPAGAKQQGSIFARERIAAGRSATATVSMPTKATNLKLSVVGTSLGQDRTFPAIDVPNGPNGGGTFVIGYDYDLATAAFTIAAKWDCFNCLQVENTTRACSPETGCPGGEPPPPPETRAIRVTAVNVSGVTQTMRMSGGAWETAAPDSWVQQVGPEIMTLLPGASHVFWLIGLVGGRYSINVDSWTTTPDVQSGQGYSEGISAQTPATVDCTVELTNATPPNGCKIRCSH